jgi:hypothetical protein
MVIAVYAKIAPVGLPAVYGKIATPLPVVTPPLMIADTDPRPYMMSLLLLIVQARHEKRGRRPLLN